MIYSVIRPAVWLFAVGICAFLSAEAWGQVVVDGSFGHAGALTGPSYQIPATLGKTVGTNLFQSFSQFNVKTGQTATFTASAAIQNILARVTGGSSSNIDGTILTRLDTNPNTPHPATFYLINPAGVIFGPNAKLDVGGSFVVTTANTVQLADGGKFTATVNPGDSVLTSAAPAAFGFLAPQPAKLTVNGSVLTLPQGQVLSVVSGPIQITGGALQTSGGQVNLIAAGSPGTAVLNPSNPNSTVDVSSIPTLADVSLTNNATVNVSGPGGSGVDVQARNLTLASSTINAQTLGSTNGSPINLNLTGTLSISAGGQVNAQAAAGSGNGGSINIVAPTINLDGDGASAFTLISVQSAQGSTGNGGSLSIFTHQLSILDGSEITGTTSGVGTGGSITINATQSLLIDRAGAAGDFSLTGIVDRTTQSATSGGQAGSVTLNLTGATFDVWRGGIVDTSTLGSGDAGNVLVHASDIVLNRLNFDQLNVGVEDNTAFNSGIMALSYAERSRPAGNGGNISLFANTIDILNGSQVAANSLGGVAGGGSVTLEAANISIEGRSKGFLSGITTSSFGPQAGNVTITANQSLLLSDGAFISTFGNNNGADISIFVGNSLTLRDSKINAQAGLNGGIVSIQPTVSSGAPFVILADSVIDSISGEVNDIIQIARSAILIQSTDSLILASQVSLPPPVDITSSLLSLPDASLGGPPRLEPSCAVRMQNASSFTVEGRGGRPLDPNGWAPSFVPAPAQMPAK